MSFHNPKYPTHHDSKNGWNGANNFQGDDVPCDKCGTVDVERVMYHGGEGEIEHIVVCWECSKQLSEDWYGCGCGG